MIEVILVVFLRTEGSRSTIVNSSELGNSPLTFRNVSILSLSLKVAYGEVGLGKAIRAAVGVWDKEQKVWR
jgi:hypothetical protein